MKILAALLLLATPAFADDAIEVVPTCVTIDNERDALPEAERADARDRLVRALELQDRLVVAIGCQDTVILWHERTGDGVIIHVRNALGGRRLRVPLDADMFATYTRLARALYEARPVVKAPPAVDEPPALDSAPPLPVDSPPDDNDSPPLAVDNSNTPPLPPPSQAANEVPQREEPGATRLWYYRGGFGMLGDTSGLAVVFGYRRGTSATVADFSLRYMGTDEERGNRRATSFRGQVLSFTRPRAASSFYWGGGASFVSANYEMEGNGSGFQLESTAGMEWNRDQRWRYSIEANFGVPFYTVGDSYYPASFAISFGIAH